MRIRTEVGIITIKKVLSIRITAMDRGVSLICIGDGVSKKIHSSRITQNAKTVTEVSRELVVVVYMPYVFLTCLFLFFLCAFTAFSVLFHKILEAERGRSFLSRLSITFC